MLIINITLLFVLLTILLFHKVVATSINNKKILIIGGSGRVGGSSLCSLNKIISDNSNNNRYKNIELFVGGRNINNWLDYKKLKSSSTLIDSSHINFINIDINNENQLDDVIPKYDLIINTAGPFQGLKRSLILEKSLYYSKKYIDVCDDIKLSRILRTKDMQQYAKKNSGTAIISTGIWPGCSSLLADKIINNLNGSKNINKVIFSFFTSGSGNAGPTILSATFLILGEKVLTYKNSIETYYKSASNPIKIDFGNKIGKREVTRLNLIECESCYQSSNKIIPNIETYFGTSPPIWNTLFVLMANIIPQNILQNRNYMNIFAKISLPMVRLVDKFVGARNAIRVDVTTNSGKVVTGILSHEELEKCVGDAISYFALELLYSTKNNIPYGIYFPEEIPNKSIKNKILDLISKDAILYSLDWKTNEL